MLMKKTVWNFRTFCLLILCQRLVCQENLLTKNDEEPWCWLAKDQQQSVPNRATSKQVIPDGYANTFLTISFEKISFHDDEV
jgi:hypothetical protein